MLHKEIPFIRIGLPLCAGVIAGLYYNTGVFSLVSVLIVIIAGFIISTRFNNSSSNYLFGYTNTLALFTAGMLLYNIEKDSLTRLEPAESVYACTLADFPEEKENSIRLIAKLNYRITDSGAEAINGSIILYNKKDSLNPNLLPGDHIVIKCKPAEFANRGNPYEFDYKFYMKNQGAGYYAFTQKSDILSHSSPERRKLRYKALVIRSKIIDMYRDRGISGDKLALVAAITLGEKKMLEQDQKEVFIKAGVIHIMAVSGLHVGIMSLFVFNLLFFLKGRLNKVRVLVTILILWSFAFIAGLSPSVLRATMMFSFLQAGKLMKRPVNAINSVLASAFIIILIKPSSIFETGFLLSYSAVIYIISFYNDLYSKIQFRNWFADKIWQSVVLTIVAQAGTLPLTIMFFNRFPVYFIITNILIAPLSFMLIATGCLVQATFPLASLSHLLASFLNFLTSLTELITKKVSMLPHSTIENIGMSLTESILLTVTIYLFLFLILKRKSFSLLLPLILLFLYVSAGTVSELSTSLSNELIVFNTPGVSTIGIRTGKNMTIFSDSSISLQEVKRYSANLGLKINDFKLQNNDYCVKAGRSRIMIADKPDKEIIQSFQPDILIIKDLYYSSAYIISSAQSVRSLIFTSEVPYSNKYLKENNFNKFDTLHIVTKSGAFSRRI